MECERYASCGADDHRSQDRPAAIGDAHVAVQEGNSWVLVAGSDHDTGWLLNLRERPDVEVSRKGRPDEAMHARIATPEERARLWPQVVAAYKGYAKHQEGTDREIPLVMLEPPS